MRQVSDMENGSRVSGRYKILGKIGSGGMANVYLAEDLILEREVAVKMMSLTFDEDEESDNLRRFQREALSTTELIHPNIVNIYDVGEGERPYIVMEYVDGTDLKRYIQDNHPIPYSKVIKIMSQILSGISYAHANGVIHRDIKPHNILIDKEGTVKITDFGIAVALSQNSITQTNSILGSVQYISPEQARGNVVTKQSDIYSLGIVLYEMLTGVVPFDGESAVSVALKHFQSPIPSLREFDSRIPQPLENVVLKAAAKEANDRYDSVSEMQADLETALDPSRRDEPIFIPADVTEEDTLVMKEPLIVAERDDVDNAKTAVITGQPSTPEIEVKKEKKKRPWWLLILPLILVGAFLFWALTRPQEIQLPEELINSTLEEAIELLQKNNLLLGETIEQPNNEVEAGLVFRTSPNPGSTVREGASIDLYVSEGEESYKLEDYSGQNYEEIRAELSELGFTVESESTTDEELPEGAIISQDLDSGEEVIPSETTIKFTISSGRQRVELQDFTGGTLTDVEVFTRLNNLELRTTQEASEDVPAGQIISQTPKAGEMMFLGQEVSVVISTGPEEIELINFAKEITIPYQEPAVEEEPVETNEEGEEIEAPTPSPTYNDVKIFINDYNRDYVEDDPAYQVRIVQDTQYTMNFVVEEGSYATYRVEIDGQLFIEETARPGD